VDVEKEVFDPLFEPGFRDVLFEDSKECLTQLLVRPFSNSGHRAKLLKNLFVLLEAVERSGGASKFAEIWIDGSFVTKKVEPNDIDIVVVQKSGVYIDQELLKVGYWEKVYKCQIIHIEDGNRAQQAEFLDWFGHDQEQRPKGIVRIRFIGGSDEKH